MSSSTIRFALFSLIAALLLAAPDAAFAQKRKKPKKEKEAAAQPAEPAVPPEAIEEFQKGAAAQKTGDLDQALEHYEKAFELYPDPQLQLAIGEVHRLKGTAAMEAEEYEVAVAELEKAIAGFEKYLELAPEGAEAEAARQRIEVLTQGVENAKKALASKEEEERKAAEEEKEAARLTEEERRRAAAAETGTKLALDAVVVAGVDQDQSAVARLMAGGLLGFGLFALDAHLSFEGFVRLPADHGVSARSVTLLDLGMRFAFKNRRFTGPFIAAGGGFGLFSGKPRERKLDGDEMTCAGFENERCQFAIDKNISARFGLGYGFEASKQTTVAIRLEAMNWWFSVDDEQNVGSPPAIRVEKPQTALAFLAGLEFLYWP